MSKGDDLTVYCVRCGDTVKAFHMAGDDYICTACFGPHVLTEQPWGGVSPTPVTEHSSHQKEPTSPDAHAGHPTYSSTAQTLVRIADAFEALLQLLPTLSFGPGGPACGGRVAEGAEPVAEGNFSASNAPKIQCVCARCVMNTGTCGIVSSEKDVMLPSETNCNKPKRKTPAKMPCRFPDIDAPPEELSSFLAKWEIDQKDPDYKRFSLFYQANGRTMKNWKAAWRSWRERELQYQRNSTRPNQPVSQSIEYKLAWMKDKK